MPEPEALRASTPTGSVPGPARSRRERGDLLRRTLVRFLRQVVVDPVAGGRLRNHGWPAGLPVIVVAGYLMFAVAGLGVIASGPIRAHSVLIITGTGTLGLPAVVVGPLVVLFSFGLACLLAAAQHGPWWLKLLGLGVVLIVMGEWALRSPSTAGGLLGPVLAVIGLLTLLALFLVRWRRGFAWWEFVAGWALIGGVLVVGLAEARTGKVYGSDFSPLSLQLTAGQLGYLALPAALVAGAAVAEVTVRTTVAATVAAGRLAHRSWPFVLLGLVVGIRAVQGVRFWASRDPVTVGPAVIGLAAATVLLLGAVGILVRRVGRGRGTAARVSELSAELGSVGYGVAMAFVALALPVQVLAAVAVVVSALAPGGPASQWSLATTPILARIVDPSRVIIGAGLIGLAVRSARRGRTARALMLGSIGVMLVVLARQLVLGRTVSAPINADVISLVSSLVVIVVIMVSLARRRLTASRALAYASVLILSALFAYRDFVSDPVGYLLGFSGAALVLFGLTWDLLTGAGWGNGDSPRFPRPTRVLLVLTNAVLTMSVLAYAALVRDGSTTIYLDPFAEIGDLILGTALLGAATVAALDAATRNEPVD